MCVWGVAWGRVVVEGGALAAGTSRPKTLRDSHAGLIHKGVILSLGGHIHCPGKNTHLRTGRHHRSLSEHQDPCLLFSGARSLQGGI